MNTHRLAALALGIAAIVPFSGAQAAIVESQHAGGVRSL